ncbi:hypothetical protein IG631_15584 [Alternaria alternata]|nr:hypothetical protein IG631_15584 [Alternaria alternata]
MVTDVITTPAMLDARPAVKYKDVTAAYMSNEAVRFPIVNVITSIRCSLKLRHPKMFRGLLDQVKSTQSQSGKYGAHETNLSRKNLLIVLGLDRSTTWYMSDAWPSGSF